VAREAGTDDSLTAEIIGAAIEVHRHLGPGLLESMYEECLAFECASRGLAVRRQVEVPVIYKGRSLSGAYRLDLLISEEVIVEVKTVDSILGVHRAQLLTYLRLLNARRGLILNFNVPVLKDGIVRLIL